MVTTKDLITEAIEQEFSKDKELAGVEFLRAAVEYFNERREFLNESKTPHQLIKEYAAMVVSQNFVY